mgnify:CR=1 FL=1
MAEDKKSDVPETTQDKRLKRIKQLQARIAKEKALLNNTLRKERTGQLVAGGVLIEAIYKAAESDGRQRIKDQAKKYLTDERNLKRILAMFDRLDANG